MNEPQYYVLREQKLVTLAHERFDPVLSDLELKILHDAVRPEAVGLIVDSKRRPLKRQPLAIAAKTIVRASLLRWLMVDPDAHLLVDAAGLRLARVTVSADTDFSSVQMPFTCFFDHCTFAGLFVLGASAPNFTMWDCTLTKGLIIRNLQCHGNLDFEDCTFIGQIDFQDAKIDGWLSLNGLKVLDNDPSPVDLANVKVAGDVLLYEAHITRQLQMRNMTIGGDVFLTGAKLTYAKLALQLAGSVIGGSLHLDTDLYAPFAQFQSDGDLDVGNVTIGRDLLGVGSIFTKDKAPLDFSGSRVKTGTISFLNTRSAGNFDFSSVDAGNGLTFYNATLTNSGEVITLDDATIAKCFNASSITSHGSIGMYRGKIDGDFICNDSSVSSISLQSLHITGMLQAASTTFVDKDQPFCLLDSQVDNEVNLSLITTSGFIDIERSHIGADLVFSGAKIDRSNADNAVYLNDVVIQGNILLTRSLQPGIVGPPRSFQTMGEFSMVGGSVGEDVLCVGAQIGILGLRQVKIGGNLRWYGIVNAAKTKLFLNGTTVDTLIDDKDSWPGPGLLSVDGFRYQTLTFLKKPSADDLDQLDVIPPAAAQSSDDRILWLQRQTVRDQIYTQPWQQLATFFAQRGDTPGSKAVLYEMSRVQGSRRSGGLRALNLPLDLVQEDALRITVPIAVFWTIGSVVFWRARRMEAMAPRDKDVYKRFMAQEPIPEYVPFNPVIYALENVLPVVKFGQDDAWGPNPAITKYTLEVGWRRWVPRCEYRWLAGLRWALIIIGWALALILAGAIGGIFKV